MHEHLTVQVWGEVQGVFYRTTACEEGLAHNLTGFVQNKEDGSVYIEAEGSREELEVFLRWCKAGPPSAHIKRIKHQYSEDLQGFEGFVIR